MKPVRLLPALLFFFFISCDEEKTTPQEPLVADTVKKEVVDQPDPNCLKLHENFVKPEGEWMEVGKVNGIVSEIECAKIDTTGMSTRRDRQWAFQNDSLLLSLFTDGGRAFYYKFNERRDTMTMVDDHHLFYDTLRVTRLDEQYMIVASRKESVVYMKRK